MTRRRVPRAFRSLASYAACILLAGARSDPPFMSYDIAARLAKLTIIAAYDQSNSGFNFNGGSHGTHRITVPLGWTVTISFVNRDVIEHSVALVREVTLLPARIVRPAIPGAASRAVESGLPPGSRQDGITFVVERSGSYLLACGVPGHTAVGSYLRLTVSTEASVPTYDIGVVTATLGSRE